MSITAAPEQYKAYESSRAADGTVHGPTVVSRATSRGSSCVGRPAKDLHSGDFRFPPDPHQTQGSPEGSTEWNPGQGHCALSGRAGPPSVLPWRGRSPLDRAWRLSCLHSRADSRARVEVRRARRRRLRRRDSRSWSRCSRSQGRQGGSGARARSGVQGSGKKGHRAWLTAQGTVSLGIRAEVEVCSTGGGAPGPRLVVQGVRGPIHSGPAGRCRRLQGTPAHPSLPPSTPRPPGGKRR